MVEDATLVQDDVDFRAIHRRFLELNQARLERTREALTERQRGFLALLPLLFEVNHPLLPGFVSKYAPAGVAAYQPDRTTLHLARRLAKSFQYQSRTRKFDPILAIYLMGSPGSVAFSSRSDLDIWVCHDPSLTQSELEMLQRKAVGVEAFAAALELEAHIFLVDSERFRRGELQDLSSESSGSAQHYLLLEEFYRTGILVAGYFPLWWLVPPEREADYERFVEEVKRRRFVHARDYIDFGSLTQLPAEEFFGAALWQLSKGIDSPYKSVLKLLLIEAYASEYPAIDLLSLTFKKAVYAGTADLAKLDPYVMMLEKVDAYLSSRQEPLRLELARRCFYFKIDERLSRFPPDAELDWRRELLRDLSRSWGWSRADLMLMDVRDSWKVHRVAEERRVLFEALSASYRFLSDFARQHAGLAMISQRDLTVLGRKLYAAFERKPGKLELLNQGITGDLLETHLTLHEVIDEDFHSTWSLYLGVVTPENTVVETPVRRARSVLEILAWCYFNRILDRRTALAVYSRGNWLTTLDIKAVVDRLHSRFPTAELQHGDLSDFAGPARLTQSELYVNVGVQALDAFGLPKGRVVAGRADPLSYGVSARNMVLSLDLLLVTSWHEVMTHRYSGGRGLMECLCTYLKWSPPSGGQRPPELTAFGLSAYRGNTVANRVAELLRDIVDCFYDGKRHAEHRYLIAMERGYFILYFEGDAVRYRELENLNTLFRYLAAPQPRYTSVVFDRHALRETVLPLIYEYNQPGIVQFFYRTIRDEAEVYVLDERGALFHQRLPFHDADTLLSHYSLFFESVLNRINFLMQEGETVRAAEGLEFHALRRDGAGHWRVDRRAGAFQRTGRQYFHLQVLVDVDEQQATVFTLYCNGREFSTLEFGNQLFEAVAKHVIALRKSGQAYPIYITDISLSRAVLGRGGVENKVQTVHFLNYKRRIEELLNRALQQHG